MFKEQLHDSFDPISPSPELLARISAMMNEEVSRPKPGIRMNAVRYGGIAAALVIAAGSTFALTRLSDDGVQTASESAPVTTGAAETAAAAAADIMEDAEAVEEDGAVMQIYMVGDTEPETFRISDEAEEAEEAIPEAALFSASPDTGMTAAAQQTVPPEAAGTTAVTTAAKKLPETSVSSTENRAAEAEAVSAAQDTTQENGIVPPAIPEEKIVAEKVAENSESSDNSDAAQLLIDDDTDEAEEYPVSEVNIPETDNASGDIVLSSGIPSGNADANPGTGADFGYEDEDDADDINIDIDGDDAFPNGYVLTADDEAVDEEVASTYDPSTPGGNVFRYEEPFVEKFCITPDALLTIPEGVKVYTEDGYIMGERWHEYFAACTPGYVPSDEDVPPDAYDTDEHASRIVTSIDDTTNVYNFIRYFGIPEDKVRAALSGIYTDEELDTLFSGDKAAITAAFASDHAVVKGDKIYSPEWLNSHSLADWKAAGITKDDILAKKNKLEHIPLLRRDLQSKLTSKVSAFLKD